jgi:hypothetical protein
MHPQHTDLTRQLTRQHVSRLLAEAAGDRMAGQARAARRNRRRRPARGTTRVGMVIARLAGGHA